MAIPNDYFFRVVANDAGFAGAYAGAMAKFGHQKVIEFILDDERQCFLGLV